MYGKRAKLTYKGRIRKEGERQVVVVVLVKREGRVVVEERCSKWMAAVWHKYSPAAAVWHKYSPAAAACGGEEERSHCCGGEKDINFTLIL